MTRAIALALIAFACSLQSGFADTKNPNDLTYREALALIDACPGDTRLDKLDALFTSPECTPAPTPEELEGVHVGFRFWASEKPIGQRLLIARDPQRKSEGGACNGCAYDDLRALRLGQPDYRIVPTAADLAQGYEHWWRGYKTQTYMGLHENGPFHFTSPEDRTGTDPSGPYVRCGLVEKVRRIGPLLILSHVLNKKFVMYDVFFHKYPLPPPPLRTLHFAGFGR